MSFQAWCMAIMGVALSLVTLISIGWDIYVLHWHPELPTVSAYMLKLGKAYPFFSHLIAATLGFIGGGLVSHFFWSQME